MDECVNANPQMQLIRPIRRFRPEFFTPSHLEQCSLSLKGN
jgi:hypothetical protein